MRDQLAVAFVVVVATTVLGGVAGAQEPDPPRNVDQWHEVFAAGIGADYLDPSEPGWSLGFYPSLGVVVGPSEWIAFQVHGYVSLSHHGKFSLFTGYGYARGPDSESQMATLGWGGVRRLPGARPQRGFYGKFLRYRRLEDFEHGVHHGLSVGSEAGAGIFGFAVEIGAARSDRNHWALTAQIGVKLALPIILPLTRSSGTEPAE